MPTYEYRCGACEAEFEKFQRMSDEPVAECPECGAAAERRISAGAGLLFKGSGFYITDYRSEGYQEAAKKDSKGGEAKSGESTASSSSPSNSSGSNESPAASGSGSSTSD